MKYRIGEVARVLGISTDLLRYYEKKGVVAPQKGKYNDYRYYDSWDINFLLDCLWFKNFGFSLDQISDMVRSYSASDITDMFLAKEEELESTIKRCELLLQRSAEHRLGMERIKLLGSCNVEVSPSGACFLNRYGDEYPDTEDLEPYARRWLELMPYNHRYFELSERALCGEDPSDYRWGYFISDDYIEKLGTKPEPPMIRLNAVKSLHTVCRSSGKGMFGPRMLSHAVDYAKENGLDFTGPARGTLLASVCEDGELWGYFEAWIPIE